MGNSLTNGCCTEGAGKMIGGDKKGECEWDENQILSSGANKDIYLGTFGKHDVAVCLARTNGSTDTKRLKLEIDIFEKIGSHPYIIQMVTKGLYDGRQYFAVEAVQPIGYDLSRMVNQYSWADQPVPSAIMAKISKQLSSALQHMHSRNLLHRDLKTENVLVTRQHDAKLIDMGIVCPIGTIEKLRVGYMAPELCDGKDKQTPAVDCWGMGLILHQVYQASWDVLDCTSKSSVKYKKNRPSQKFPMNELIREAMCNLLVIDVNKRWNLNQLKDCAWFQRETTAKEKVLAVPDGRPRQSRRIVRSNTMQRAKLRRYEGGFPPLTAYAVMISYKRQPGLKGKAIKDIHFGRHNTQVLLIDNGDDNIDKLPGPATVFQDGAWVFLGMGTDSTEEHISGLEELIFGGKKSIEEEARTVKKQGSLLAFTLEFDAFVFPPNIPAGITIGNKGLDLRAKFGINLAGIIKPGHPDPIWFPDAVVTVSPGDWGLIVRRPCQDGSSEPTAQDSEISRIEEVRFR